MAWIKELALFVKMQAALCSHVILWRDVPGPGVY